MATETFKLDESTNSRMEIEKAVEQAMREKSMFGLDIQGQQGTGTVRYESSMNLVVVDQTPRHIRVKVDATDKVHSAVKQAIEQMGGNSGQDYNSDRTYTDDDFQENNGGREYTDADFQRQSVSANIELMEDGTVNIDWGDSQMTIDTMVGIFMPKPGANRSEPLIYVDENTNLTDTDVDEIAEEVRRQLRQYV